ncbi:MAG: hypothetical protein IKZ44_05055 [Clostridia bacterium]|nr:hypothetical protein [Clostridia bacterium]
MKKLLAMLLSLMMVFALIPATLAEGAEDVTLVIKGGETNDHMEVLEGDVHRLVVKVTLNGAAEEQLYGLKFELQYNPDQVTVKDYWAADAGWTVVNGTEAGKFVIAIANDGNDALVFEDETPILTLYVELSEDLEAGDEIAFTLADGGYLETGDAAKPVSHKLVADFKPFVVSDTILFDGIVKFNEGEVQYKGETPYVIWDHDKGIHEPAFTVYEKDGETVIDPENYDFEYKENKQPGTGYLFVYFKGAYTGEKQLFFKIYLPATTKTTVENVANGIKLTWEPVEDAAGYVIYRRAWSSTTGGWTAFARWDNTTETTYLDGHDDAHKVFAGTRYQYGVKAYFARRTDPVAGEQIGGNVNEPSGNFNLGNIGPLKTTVRITTRELKSVTPGTKEMTIKWTPTKNFTGIQVQYAEDANFKTNSKNYKIEFELDENGNVVTPVVSQDVIKNLTSGKTVYVRIRSFCLFEGMNYYGEWSNVLNGKVK